MDLRLARRKAGYTQRDCAHLLGVHKSRISDLERGKRRPTLRQICTLSLVYGRSFESLFAETLRGARSALKGRIPTLPAMRRSYVANFNRDANLARLEKRLVDETNQDDSA